MVRFLFPAAGPLPTRASRARITALVFEHPPGRAPAATDLPLELQGVSPLPRRARSFYLFQLYWGKRRMAENMLERARAIAVARSHLAEFRSLSAKYASNVERALGREGMSEVSGIDMELRELVEVLKDKTQLPL